MPLFKWYGLTAAGVVVQGKERAADAAEMQHLLAQRGVTILSSNPCSEYISTEKVRTLRVTVRLLQIKRVHRVPAPGHVRHST